MRGDNLPPSNRNIGGVVSPKFILKPAKLRKISIFITEQGLPLSIFV